MSKRTRWTTALWAIAAAVIAATALALLWLIASMPTVCAAIYPAPPGCAANARQLPTLVGSAAIVALFIATVIVGPRVTPRRRSSVLGILVVAQVVLSIVAAGVTLFASGFVVSF